MQRLSNCQENLLAFLADYRDEENGEWRRIDPEELCQVFAGVVDTLGACVASLEVLVLTAKR